MALISCPECGKSVSDQAETCIHCGVPLHNPLDKLIPKMDQLWLNNQDKECLDVCNEILLIKSDYYVAILRRALCKRFCENNERIGLDAYLNAVKIFNATEQIDPKDADMFAYDIGTLFSCVVGLSNHLDNLKASVDQLYAQRMNPLMPTFGPKGEAATFMYLDANNSYKQRKAELLPLIDEWTRVIYNNFPKRLAKISKVGQQKYRYIAENAAIMVPSLRTKIEQDHPSLFQNNNNSSSSSGGCYVATCVYGSYDCPQVWTLRRFRDYALASTWYGRTFIRTYYAISPTLVKWFGNTAWFCNLWKPILNTLVQKLNASGFENTPYLDKKW